MEDPLTLCLPPHCEGRETVVQCPICKKNIGGSPTGERVEAPQALTCNTNTGIRIDPPPPGAQIDGDSGGQKIIGRVEPPIQSPRSVIMKSPLSCTGRRRPAGEEAHQAGQRVAGSQGVVQRPRAVHVTLATNSAARSCRRRLPRQHVSRQDVSGRGGGTSAWQPS